VTRAKHSLQACLQRRDLSDEALLGLLNDRRRAPDALLPETGLGPERERMLSSMFIEGDRYGTRASTVLRIARDATVSFTERTYEGGAPTETRRFSFEVQATSVS
jgi:uncharacterized protein with NRDE domain